MKKMLFLLFLSPIFLKAQRTEWDIAYNKATPSDIGQRVHMPPRDYNPHFKFDDTVNYRQKNRVFVITEDSVYRKLFWRYVYTVDSLKKYKQSGAEPYYLKWIEKHLVDSLPVIDFSKNELVLYSACAQCLAFCHHDEGHDYCHRNACNFRETWFVRSKKKPG